MFFSSRAFLSLLSRHRIELLQVEVRLLKAPCSEALGPPTPVPCTHPSPPSASGRGRPARASAQTRSVPCSACVETETFSTLESFRKRPSHVARPVLSPSAHRKVGVLRSNRRTFNTESRSRTIRRDGILAPAVGWKKRCFWPGTLLTQTVRKVTHPFLLVVGLNRWP